MNETARPGPGLVIGLSACMFPPDPTRAIFKGKRLVYMEEAMSHWIMSTGALCFLVPTTPTDDPRLPELIGQIDGLVLAGGVDVSPLNYGEEPQRPEWEGDPFRDRYELALLHAAVAGGIPVLGICRGAQIINVGFGGSLYQDIETQVSGSLVHRDWDIYEDNHHDVEIDAASPLAQLYAGVKTSRINSIHHQAVRELGEGLQVEAVSPVDGIIESIWLKPDDHPGTPYVRGVQWHPEFQRPAAQDKDLLPAEPLLVDFLQEARRRKTLN